MSQTHFIIDRIESINEFMSLCYFRDNVYEDIQDDWVWTPLERLLVDSNHKEMVYMMDVGDEWIYIRFPLDVWKQLAEDLVQDKDFMLVISKTGNGHVQQSIPLQGFQKEASELIKNMRNNTNYGSDMISIVDEYFSKMVEEDK